MAKWVSAEGAPALGCNPAVDRKWRKMRGRGQLVWRIGSLVTVGVALSVLLAGCPDPRPAGGLTAGCQRDYGGVPGVDRVETSRLSCDAIDRLTSSMPSEPETYLSRDDSPRGLLWKCKFYGTEARPVLLRCEHGKRHFSIVKRAG